LVSVVLILASKVEQVVPVILVPQVQVVQAELQAMPVTQAILVLLVPVE
jgi:hypothetical protein